LWCDLIVADGPFTECDVMTFGYNVPCTKNFTPLIFRYYSAPCIPFLPALA
jgi:hypothetical protein